MSVKRRNFLKGVGALGAIGLTPYDVLWKFLMEGAFNPAIARDGGRPMNYVGILLFGGPARWLFDLPLMPNGNDDFYLPTAMVKSRYTDPEGLETDFAQVPIGNYHFPYIWGEDVPQGVEAGTRPLADLSKNMYCIRGVTTFNGHELARSNMFNPVLGLPSIHSLSLANNDVPFGALGLGDFKKVPYKSSDGTAITKISDESTPLNQLLGAFDLEQAISYHPALGTSSALEDYIDKSVNRFISSHPDQSKEHLSMYVDKRNAKLLFKKGVEGLSEAYSGLFNKYQRLLERAFLEHNWEGIDTHPIVSNGHQSFHIDGPNKVIQSGENLLDYITSDFIPEALACYFSVAEYVLTSGLTSSVSFSVNYMKNLNIPAVTVKGASTSNAFMASSDSHFVGTHGNLVYFSKYYKGLSTCLLEFIDSLKSYNNAKGESLWDNTLVHLTGDFGRTPVEHERGTSHGPDKGNVTLLSGVFKDGPFVMGDIVTPKGRRWTDGEASGEEALKGRKINTSHIASTVAEILDCDSPVPNEPPLLKRVSGEIFKVLKSAKNHEES